MPESSTIHNPAAISLPPAMMHPAELNRRVQMIRMTGQPIGRSSRSGTGKPSGRPAAVRQDEDLSKWVGLELRRQGRAAVVMIDGPIWFDQMTALWIGGTPVMDLVDVINEAASDDTVDTVVLDIDSPGGSVAGSHDVIDAVRRCAARKTTVALCHDMACSMAYWIACECSKIFGTPTSETGSIGTIAVCYDTSEMAASRGERAIAMTSGAEHKALGIYGVPIGDDMVQSQQGIIEEMGRQFRDAVVARRPIDEAALLEMRGAAYYGQSQIEMGLVDELIGTHEFYEQLHAGTLDTGRGDGSASGQTKHTPPAPEPTPELTPQSAPTGVRPSNERTAMNDELKEALAALEGEDKEEALSILKDGEDEEPTSEDPKTDEEEPTSETPNKDEDEQPSAMSIGSAKAFLKDQGLTDTNMINALACDAVEQKMDKVDLLSAALKAQRETDPEIAQEAGGSPAAINTGRGAGTGSGDSAVAKFHAAVKHEMDTHQLTKPNATAKVNREQPELRAAFVAAMN